ncbi:MAG: type II restriction endonuclease [Fibrobacter sp.]|jgi:type II restriction enzyme|uniref:type II restriction endonuclease n=1 Tax=Fibrobacter sp. TaxID=35828 RepID=UPI0025C71924|nr:type II restriction endonuclease [Fibrobacter sp.]MBQ7078879.1 type II restriction endonuclease [Fibrobacter sp.]
MAKRNFIDWFRTFRPSIATFSYYADFPKIFSNVESIKIELNILNSLIGSKNIKQEFEAILAKYPNVVKCIPVLLAVRSTEISISDENGMFVYEFNGMMHDFSIYSQFMDKSGLFDLMQNHLISNLVDYVTGVETGLDSNGRKNRGGHLMEDLVELYIKKAGFVKDKNYFKEMYISDIARKWNIDLSAISNQGKMEKRFDFVVKAAKNIYAIETNFYGGGGSKLNETARSYKTIALEAKTIPNFEFVWFTDGLGWASARNNLEETFDVLDHIYCINDMEKDIMKNVFK